MSLTYLREQRPESQADEGRIDVPTEIRQLALANSNASARVASLLGRQWSTRAGLVQSADDLLAIAERALELRRMLCGL